MFKNCVGSGGNIVYVISSKLCWSLWGKFLDYFSLWTPKKFNICLWLKSRETSVKEKMTGKKSRWEVEAFAVWLRPWSVFTPALLTLVGSNFIPKPGLLWLAFRHEFTDCQVLDAFIWVFQFNFVPCIAFRCGFFQSCLAPVRIENIVEINTVDCRLLQLYYYRGNPAVCR